MKLFRNLLAAQAAILFGVPALADISSNKNSEEINPQNNSTILLADKSDIASTAKNDDNQRLKITVTGTRTPKLVEEYPGSVTVLDTQDLQSNDSQSLRDLLEDVPGLSTKKTYRSDIKGPENSDDLNIRGLEGNQILFLVDGIKLPYYGYNATFGRGDYVDFNTLKSVEVLKGASSALYGSDAMGGVISFRSLEANDILKDGEDNSFEIPFSYNGANKGFNEAIKWGARFNDKLSGAFVISKEDSSEFDIKADEKYINDSNSDGLTLFSNISYNINEDTTANFIFENVQRDSNEETKPDNLKTRARVGGTYKYDYTKLKSNIESDRNRYSLAIKYDNPNDQKFIDYSKIQVFTQTIDVEDDSERDYTYYPGGPSGYSYSKVHDYSYENDSYGGEIELKSNINSGNKDHNLTYGLEYNKEDSKRVKTTNSSGTITTVKDSPDNETDRFGIYLQDEINYDNWDLIAGVRYDSYDLKVTSDSEYTSNGDNVDTPVGSSENSISPKLAALYKVNPQLTAYAQYARGFRAPANEEINNSYSKEAHGYIIYSAPNLKPEKSNNFEVGLKGSYEKNDYNLSVFYNTYEDYIEPYKEIGSYTVAGRGGSTTEVVQYKTSNIGSAEIYGAELSSEHRLSTDGIGISFLTSLSYLYGQDTKENVPLKTIDPMTAKLGLRYKTSNNKWQFDLLSKYVAEPRDDKEKAYKGGADSETTAFRPESFITFDLTSNYKSSDRLNLDLGLFNIFDTRYYNYSDVRGKAADLWNLERYSQPGRHVKAGFNFKF